MTKFFLSGDVVHKLVCHKLKNIEIISAEIIFWKVMGLKFVKM